ncbi:MAG: hypothetical protein HQK75_14865 [Candidatus Magnetomorum sp.]|nr:hypothetical protein [Candidatus Magnetomorum sp.]
MKRSIQHRVCFFLMVMMIGCSLAAYAKDLKGTVQMNTVGTGLIEEENVDQAREVAIKSALSTAVESAVGQILSADMIEANFQLLSDRIYNPIQKFIKGFRVLAEAQSNEFYRVLVRSTISVDTLSSNLSEIGVSMEKKILPGILMFISEQNIHQSPYQWWRIKSQAQPFNPAEIELNKILKQKNYQIVSRFALVRKLWARTEFQQDTIEKEEIINFARTNNAQIVLIGKVETYLSPGVMGSDMASIDAKITLQAFQTQTGTLVSETTQEARAINTNELLGAKEAVTKAASQAAEILAGQIETGLKKAGINASQVELLVSGTKKLAYFVSFRKILASEIQGVSAIRLKELKSNEAKIEVDFTEGGDMLAKRLMLKSFDNFGLNILKITSTHISLALVSKEELKQIRSDETNGSREEPHE